jgi:hypothetical protein
MLLRARGAGVGRRLLATGAAETQRKSTFDMTKLVVPPHQVVYTPSKEPSAWTPESRRTGLLCLKAGMIGDWDVFGVRRALTVLKVGAGGRARGGGGLGGARGREGGAGRRARRSKICKSFKCARWSGTGSRRCSWEREWRRRRT